MMVLIEAAYIHGARHPHSVMALLHRNLPAGLTLAIFTQPVTQPSSSCRHMPTQLQNVAMALSWYKSCIPPSDATQELLVSQLTLRPLGLALVEGLLIVCFLLLIALSHFCIVWTKRSLPRQPSSKKNKESIMHLGHSGWGARRGTCRKDWVWHAPLYQTNHPPLSNELCRGRSHQRPASCPKAHP